MSLEALIAVVPPPAIPFEPFDGPWEPLEAELRLRLPQDYKDFVRLYGLGDFRELLTVYSPSSSSPYCRLDTMIGVWCRQFIDDDDFPYPMWPKRGGLVPFGVMDEGGMLAWLPLGPPETWCVVVWSRGTGECEVLDYGLAGLLVSLATGEGAPEIFEADLLPCDVLFAPFTPQASGEEGPAGPG